MGLAQHPPPQQQQHVLLPQAVVLQFPCPVCQVVFPAQDLLEAHAKTHSQRNKCPVCALTFPKAHPPPHTDAPIVRIAVSYSFDTNLDPDPAFRAEYRSGSGSRVLMTKN